MCSSGNPPVSFAVSLCVLSCFFPSCFVHNFLKFLSILEIVNLNSLVGLTFSLPPGCSLPFDVSPYAGHSALFLCTLWDFGYWKGLVSPVMAVTLGSRGWLYSLALGSPLTSCLLFCLSFHSLQSLVHWGESQGLLSLSTHLSFPTPGHGFVVCQLHKHSQTP